MTEKCTEIKSGYSTYCEESTIMETGDETETEIDKKRKRNETSSVSDADNSFNLSGKIQEDEAVKAKYTCSNPKEKKKDRKKKKKNDNDDDVMEDSIEENIDSISRRMTSNEKTMNAIHDQLKQINSKMETITTKGEIEAMFKQMFDKSLANIESKIREDVYKSVSHRIDIIEGDIHTKNTVIDKLQEETKDIKAKLEIKTTEIEAMRNEIKDMKVKVNERNQEIQSFHDKHDNARKHYIKKSNELEQYSRRNSVRLTGPGLPIEEVKETAMDTTKTAVKILNDTFKLNISEKDIDIAHRMGIMQRQAPRSMIIKFTSRLTKIATLKDKRSKLKGTGVYVQEDLTLLNVKVLKAVRESTRTESAWSIEGQIYAKYKGNGRIEKINYEDFGNWIQM